MKKIISLLAVGALLLCMVAPVLAVNIFTLSVERGAAPKIIPPTIAGHGNAIAAIYDENGKLLAVVENGDLDVVPFASKNTPNEEARGKLDAAYEEIRNAGSLADVIPGLVGVREDVEPDEYVAKALFDLDLAQDIIDFLKNHPGSYLEVIFDTKFASAADVPTIVYNCGEGWKVIEKKNVRFNASNGSITVRFYELCPIMLLLPDDGRLLVGEAHIVSPGTVEEPSYDWILAVSAVVMVSAATAFVVSTKKRHA